MLNLMKINLKKIEDSHKATDRGRRDIRWTVNIK
jgi:hypothetical protein